MKLKCTHCDHVWETKKEKKPTACPFCKYSLYYHEPIVINK